jgi:hypothetical protein
MNQEAATLADRTESAGRRLLGLPRMFLLHVRRTFAGNLQTVPVTEREKRALEGAGIADEALQHYVAWRRSILLLVVPPTVLGAVLFTQRIIRHGFEGLTWIGATLVVIDAVLLYLLPVAAVLAARTWTRHHVSHRILFHGWIISFLFPILYALCPFSWRFDLRVELDDPELEKHARDLALVLVGMFVGLNYYIALMPTVMSLIPGLIRASVRLKSLVPAFMVPGWFLMAAAPLYLLLWLVVFVAINAFAGNALLIGGVLLWIGAPMIFVVRSDTFLRPLDAVEGGRSIGRLQTVVNGCLLLALVLVITYLFTTRIYGIALVGIDQERSLSWIVHNRPVQEWHAEEWLQPELRPASLLWIGDTHIYRYLFEYMGRSLYMTVVFADLLMHLEVTVWRQEKRFFQTEAAASYDRFMGSVEKVYNG